MRNYEAENVPENPAAGERVYVRNRRSLERGYLVKRGGNVVVKLDRGENNLGYEQLFPNNEEWEPDVDKHPLTKAQVAQICWAADQELCRVIGIRRATMSRPGENHWLSLPDKERIAMCNGVGPKDPPIRALAWERLWSFYQEFMR
jgi:hypothetical protein